MESNGDIRTLRDLARQYAEAAAKPIQNERRDLWRAHNSLKATRPPVLVIFNIKNCWCRERFDDCAMQCQDPFYREHERALRMALFHDSLGDDFVVEPWITQYAAGQGELGRLWGVEESHTDPGVEGGAWKYDPPIRVWTDMSKLKRTSHHIDEAVTARNVARLRDAIGDIIEVNADRGPIMQGFRADISTTIAKLRGLEQLMSDMYEHPAEIHKLLAFLRDGILACHEEAERAGDWGLANHNNQAVPYCNDLKPPSANALGQRRKDLWCHCAAQEFTLISPAMHEEFLLRYQIPIIEKFGLVSYGCCEDLTRKITMLRKIPNLRLIGVAPAADVGACAEQIGTDYVLSWRPNPTDMVCGEFSESRVRRIIRDAMNKTRGCYRHILLKDVETVEGERDRLKRWVTLARDIADSF